jgi:hypothetical protein
VLKNGRSILVVVLTAGLIAAFGAGEVLGDTIYVPKDPAFARRIGFGTGIVIPLVFGTAGVATSSNANDDEGRLFVGFAMTYLSILTPPLGNVYSGVINKKIAILYGAANLTYLTGLISYYRQGSTTRQPTSFEGLMWFAGFALRISSGVLDWMTASETAVRKNVERSGASPQSYVTPVLFDDGKSLNAGLCYARTF